MLGYLATVAQGPCLKIEVLLHVVSAIFDLSPSMATHLPVPLWKRCVSVVLDIMAILGQHPSIVVDEAFEGSAERTEEPSKPEDMKVPGSLPAVVERLDDELFKSLQVRGGLTQARSPHHDLGLAAAAEHRTMPMQAWLRLGCRRVAGVALGRSWSLLWCGFRVCMAVPDAGTRLPCP